MAQTLGDATISELETGLTGSLVRHGDGEYEEARHIWNGAIDKRPAMIVRPASREDVVRTVRFAASEGLPIAVQLVGRPFADREVIAVAAVLESHFGRWRIHLYE